MFRLSCLGETMRTLILTAAACLVLAQPALAQSQPEAGPSKAERAAVSREDGSEAHRLALSRRYVQLMQGEQLEEHMRAMIEASTAADGDTAGMSAEDRAFMVDLTTDLTTDLVPQMMERMVPVFAQSFSTEELQALLDFYDNEVGREILRKTYLLMPQVNEAVMSLMPQLFDKMALRICDHYGCDASEVRSAMLEGAGLTSMPADQGPVGKL